jgi:CheY-like chemotaxis protein
MEKHFLFPEKYILNKKTIIVALTAGTMKGDKEKCIEIGMDDYASKPFVKDTIANLINKWLLNKI